jgi:hypothetical protein
MVARESIYEVHRHRGCPQLFALLHRAALLIAPTEKN